MWNSGALIRSTSYTVKLFTSCASISRGLFWSSPSVCAVLDSVHQLPLVPRMSWSPRPLMAPWLPLELCVPMMAAFDPVTLMNGLQPLPLDATVPQVGSPDSW